jgi:hypothetical protein
MLQEVHVPQMYPTVIFGDALSVLRAANNAASMKRSGYLRHKMAFVQEERRQKTVDFRKLAGDHNPADSFTKYTAFAKWKSHMEFVRNSKIVKVE